MLTVFAVGQMLGKWQLYVLADSLGYNGYIMISKMSLYEMLGTIRTLGYPLLLKAVAVVSPDYTLVPYVQLTSLFLMVFFLNFSMRRYGASPWQAFAVSTGVLYGATNWMIGALLTDCIAQTLSVTAIGFLLWLVADRRSLIPWCGLLISLAATYHMRPAYLFLVPFAPCFAVLLLRIRASWTGEPFCWKALFVGLSAGTVLPYLGFCLLRLVLVGHFGLVAFAGQLYAPFAVEFLDTNLVENELSSRYRPLAREYLAERERLGIVGAFKGNGWIDLKQWETNYDIQMQQIVLPVAKRIYGDDHITWNRELASFSREVIGLRKGKYILLYVYSMPRAVAKLLYRSWALQALIPITALLFVIRRWLFRHRPGAAEWQTDPRDRGVLLTVFCLAVLYFFVDIGLVLSVLFVDSRYALPAGIFVPALFALLILRELQMIRFVIDNCKNRGA
jgi:hypothetical protein